MNQQPFFYQLARPVMTTIIEAHPGEVQPELLNLTHELHWDRDIEKSVRILRTILHSLRDLLTLDEAIAVLLLLPHAMRALFVENWNTADLPSVSPEASDFLDVVRKKAGKLAFCDFATKTETEKSVCSVFGYIQSRLTYDQMLGLMRHLPSLVRPYLQLGKKE